MPPPPPPSSSSLKPHQNPLQNPTFLPKPTSKHPLKPTHLLKMHPSFTFTTPKSLSDYLKTTLIPPSSLSSWGTQPGTKNIHNLFQELTLGETSLNPTHNPPLITLNVVVCIVKDAENRILVESQQELSNGDVRVRFRPLFEKMKMGESVEGDAVRAVNKELGKGREGVVRVVMEMCRRRVEEKVSVSYPGLPACYVLYSVDVFVDRLPDCDEFCTVEEGEGEGEEDGKAVKCRKHYWKWLTRVVLNREWW